MGESRKRLDLMEIGVRRLGVGHTFVSVVLKDWVRAQSPSLLIWLRLIQGVDQNEMKS
jgi:hypothetical protein